MIAFCNICAGRQHKHNVNQSNKCFLFFFFVYCPHWTVLVEKVPYEPGIQNTEYKLTKNYRMYNHVESNEKTCFNKENILLNVNKQNKYKKIY